MRMTECAHLKDEFASLEAVLAWLEKQGVQWGPTPISGEVHMVGFAMCTSMCLCACGSGLPQRWRVARFFEAHSWTSARHACRTVDRSSTRNRAWPGCRRNCTGKRRRVTRHSRAQRQLRGFHATAGMFGQEKHPQADCVKAENNSRATFRVLLGKESEWSLFQLRIKKKSLAAFLNMPRLPEDCLRLRT